LYINMVIRNVMRWVNFKIWRHLGGWLECSSKREKAITRMAFFWSIISGLSVCVTPNYQCIDQKWVYYCIIQIN
jgi:hypothetical protein